MKGPLIIDRSKIRRLTSKSLVDHLGQQKDLLDVVSVAVSDLQQELIRRNRNKIKYHKPAVRLEGNLYKAFLFKREHHRYDHKKLREMVSPKILEACTKTTRHNVVSVTPKKKVQKTKRKKK